MNWKNGDIAVCIDTGRCGSGEGDIPPLKLKGEYIVNSVNVCACGSTSLDIGISHNPDIKHLCNCGRGTLGETIWWCNAKRFVKKDTRSKEEKLKDAIEKEDYELAEQIKNL